MKPLITPNQREENQEASKAKIKSMAALEWFNEEEIEAAETLMVLALYQTKKETLNSKFRFFRWGSKRRRSIPNDSKIDVEEEAETKKRFSPSSPLSFSPSRGDPSPPPPPPPMPIMTEDFKKMEQHEGRVEEQKQRIAALSATSGSPQHNVFEAIRRYQMLREVNSWLNQLQSMWREAIIAQQVGGRRRSGDLDLYSNQRLDLNWSLGVEVADRRQRSATCAAARKKRIELQRVKSSLKNQRLTS